MRSEEAVAEEESATRLLLGSAKQPPLGPVSEGKAREG